MDGDESALVKDDGKDNEEDELARWARLEDGIGVLGARTTETLGALSLWGTPEAEEVTMEGETCLASSKAAFNSGATETIDGVLADECMDVIDPAW